MIFSTIVKGTNHNILPLPAYIFQNGQLDGWGLNCQWILCYSQKLVWKAISLYSVILLHYSLKLGKKIIKNSGNSTKFYLGSSENEKRVYWLVLGFFSTTKSLSVAVGGFRTLLPKQWWFSLNQNSSCPGMLLFCRYLDGLPILETHKLVSVN